MTVLSADGAGGATRNTSTVTVAVQGRALTVGDRGGDGVDAFAEPVGPDRERGTATDLTVTVRAPHDRVRPGAPRHGRRRAR